MTEKRLKEIEKEYWMAEAPAWEAYKTTKAHALEACDRDVAHAWETYWMATAHAREKRQRATKKELKK